jgi:hypothetical protein
MHGIKTIDEQQCAGATWALAAAAHPFLNTEQLHYPAASQLALRLMGPAAEADCITQWPLSDSV